MGRTIFMEASDLSHLGAATAKSLQLCPTVQPQRQQPTRLPRPWDSPGKNTGVGCHFLLQFRGRQVQMVHFFSSPPRVDLSDRVNSMNCLNSLMHLTSGVYNMNKQEDNIGLVGGWEADKI